MFRSILYSMPDVLLQPTSRSPDKITIHRSLMPQACEHFNEETRRLYCVEWTQYSIHPKRSAMCNKCFPGPNKVLDANGISIASAVFAGLTRWTEAIEMPFASRTLLGPGKHLLHVCVTDRLTDRQTTLYSVDNNRQSAQWWNQILLLSTATTSIYTGAVDSTDRINFSNQQLYSAVRLDELQFMRKRTTI